MQPPQAVPLVVIPDRINGIDVCSLQWGLDAEKVKAAGFDFAYVKSSQYSRIMDGRFSGLVSQFKDAGMAVGAYHFCAHDTDPALQAEFFYRASEGLGSKPGDLPPMMDWEFCTASKYPNHPQHCVDWIEAFAARVTKLWYPDNDTLQLAGLRPRLPTIYTYPVYAGGHQPALQMSQSLGGYPLTFASYTQGVPLQPTRIPDHPIPLPWKSWTLCQHKGNEGRVPGVPGACDMDVFNGSAADFAAFRGINRPISGTTNNAAIDELPRTFK